jgi:F-type H+-transporting ATPase subunit a
MDLHVSVKAESLWSLDLGPLGTLNITNSFITMLIVMAALIIGCALIARRASVASPGRAQSAFEVVVEFLLNLVESTAGKRFGRQIFPLVGSLFFFIIVANYSGLLPFVGTLGVWEEEDAEHTEEAALIAYVERPDSGVTYAAQEEGATHEKVLKPFLRSPNADLNMTLAMSLITFTVVQVVGIRMQGVGGRIKHMADPVFLFPIEVVSELARIVSLSFRLFGNIFAGEVLVTVMYSMSSALLEKTKYLAFPMVIVPTVFLFLEVLFGFVQALVFALLTLIYISLVAAHHGDHDEEPDRGHGHVPVAATSPAGD